ncbi:hypothetical protein H4Q26_001471 [Puccinia striiformis f. sp. tritici PST-130]|nr:hypothetical protein H4Q26_001471 [Puccinia striiformis f. sp. tritici PST-130]
MPYSTERMGFVQLSKIDDSREGHGRRTNDNGKISRLGGPEQSRPIHREKSKSTLWHAATFLPQRHQHNLWGYSSKELRLTDNKNPFFGLNINIGSVDFYAKDLPSYLRDRLSPNNYGIYGFAANFNTQAHSSDYSFFKSISNDRNSLSEKGVVSPSHQSRSLQPAQFINKRQDDQVQCRNRNGESFLFSKNACYMAAAKMTSQKTAMSSCGSCQLVVIGPQGQISSSNMPASAIRAHTENILAGCFMSQRADSSNIVPSTFTNNTIPANAKPNYVLLLVKGSGENCDQ